MDRLTKKNEEGTAYYYPKCFQDCGGLGHGSQCGKCALEDEACSKLGEYEDLEEQGRLARLPCAVGDEVYRINRGAEEPVIPMEVSWIGIISLKGNCQITQIACRDGNDGGETCYLSLEFGKSVFFSEEEAETALYGRR